VLAASCIANVSYTVKPQKRSTVSGYCAGKQLLTRKLAVNLYLVLAATLGCVAVKQHSKGKNVVNQHLLFNNAVARCAVHLFNLFACY
jgi:hypothetical protein